MKIAVIFSEEPSDCKVNIKTESQEANCVSLSASRRRRCFAGNKNTFIRKHLAGGLDSDRLRYHPDISKSSLSS